MENNTNLKAVVIEAKGMCNAGHKKGDIISLDCLRPGGLCGFFYNQIFGNLQTLEFGGKMPWWEGGYFNASCPDIRNQVTLKIEKVK
jgi:uncharacterized repeat protein (TIGR04076 family)